MGDAGSIVEAYGGHGIGRAMAHGSAGREKSANGSSLRIEVLPGHGYDLAMRVNLSPFLLIVCAGCSFQASCGGKSLNMDNAKKFVGSSLAREAGQEPTEVTCPDKVKMEKGKSFDCTVKFGGPTATVTMHQDDDQGNVTVTNITGILISKKAEGVIAKEVSSQVQAQVTVDCGDRVRTAKAGEKFTCTAKDPNGANAQIDVIVKDDTGNVSWKLIPPTAPAGDAPPAPGAAETPPPAAPAPAAP